jgi:acyl transferase domain-containing protein
VVGDGYVQILENEKSDAFMTDNTTDELMRDAETTRVNELAMSMPLCAVIQIALVRLLRSWGVTPTAVTSHSSGEIAAAYAAGALTLQAAMGIVFARGKLASNVGSSVTKKGGMLAVGLGAEAVEKYISRVSFGKVMVACLNSPTSITASGDVPAVEELERLLKEDNIFARRLKIDAAYHSHHMQPIAAPYLAWLQQFIKAEERMDDVIYSSPTTGKRMTSGFEVSGPEHWVRSLTNPVQFVEAFRNMCFGDFTSSAPAVDVVIEVGPHAALSGPIAEITALPEFTGRKISYFSCLVRKSSAVDTMQALACDLIRQGHPINMNSVNFPHGRHGVRVMHDLPRYPWNHQTRHWTESRLNKTFRHRLEAPHDLLGSLVLGTNMLTPSWRHAVRPDDIPWVRDHVVQGNIVYPGAGYICMAIEGACQAAQASDKRILGYQLRDIDILQALIIPDTVEGVEVQLTLRPCSDKAIFAKGWKEFSVYSVSGENRWMEHCKGLISVDVASVGDAQARWGAPTSPKSKFVGSTKATDFRIRIDPRDVYEGMRSVGIYHGPIFQNLKTIRAREKQSVSAFVIADTAATMPNQYQHEHVLDPTTLDSIFQAAYTALPGAGSKMTTPLIPRSIKKLWVAHNIGGDAGHRFRVYSEIGRVSSQSFDTDMMVVDGDDDGNTDSDPVLVMDGFAFQSLGSSLQQTNPAENEKLSTVRWAPDISFTNPAFLKQQLVSTIDPTEAETIMDLRRLCCYYVNDALAALSVDDVRQLEWHHKKFYVWMKLQADLASRNELAPESSEWVNATAEDKVKLIEKATAASVNGEMVCRLGPHILAMLRREVTPLELMLEGKLLYRYYVEALKWDRSSRQMGELVKHFAFKNPRAKILEIGAGTGGTTTYNLNALGTDDSGIGPLAASYDFTDISSGFFEAAQEKFSAWKNLVRYKKLDVEQDLVKQGFETGTYDLIVASQVLHATKSMDHTMANVRKLLKPGGKLFIMETTQDQLDLQFAFGLLPGWWLSTAHIS